MKKFVLILTIMFVSVFNVVASPVNYIDNSHINKEFILFNDSIKNVDKINFNPLYKYLNLKNDQYEDFYYIHKDIYHSLQELAINKENGIQKFNHHLSIDLKNSSYILDINQYHKYLKVLNVTIRNRGLQKYLYN